jgi:GNS1/SUR4 family
MLGNSILEWFDAKESVDGGPLVTQAWELIDFVHRFPYHRLPTSSDGSSTTTVAEAANTLLLRTCLRPELVYGMVVLYWFSEKPVVWLRQLLGLHDPQRATPKLWLTRFVALHNLVLFVFSAAVAVGSWKSVLQHYDEYGAYKTYCDPSKTLWNQHHLGYWSTLFYLSKYYEWIDTWILVLKKGVGGASFLQYYHHAGIVLAMYGGVASQSAWLSWVVLLNSVIHTFMYLYFFVKTLQPSLQIRAARHLTQAQMLQFVAGIVGSSGVLAMGDACDTSSSRFALGFLQVYGLGLLAMFAAFHRRKYRATETNNNGGGGGGGAAGTKAKAS